MEQGETMEVAYGALGVRVGEHDGAGVRLQGRGERIGMGARMSGVQGRRPMEAEPTCMCVGEKGLSTVARA